MKKIVFALAAAATLALVMPASAQSIRIGENGVKVRIGDSHQRNWHRERRWHERRHCDTFWRHGRRVTVCR